MFGHKIDGDDNNNGVKNGDEDDDGDGIKNRDDPDRDGDGIPDASESTASLTSYGGAPALLIGAGCGSQDRDTRDHHPTFQPAPLRYRTGDPAFGNLLARPPPV